MKINFILLNIHDHFQLNDIDVIKEECHDIIDDISIHNIIDDIINKNY